MNRKLKTFLLISPLALLITACNGGNQPLSTTYEMVFDGKHCIANNKDKYEKDAKVEFTIEPDSGYTLPEKEDVKVTGVTTFDYVLSSDKATFTCTMPSNKVTVAVTANPDSPTTQYTLTLTLNNCNVGGSSTYSKTYDAGATIDDVTVSPDADYVLDDDSIETGYEAYWTASTGGDYVLSGLTMDASYTIAITASSEEPTTYTLDATCNNGTVSGNESPYGEGDPVSLTFTANPGYVLPTSVYDFDELEGIDESVVTYNKNTGSLTFTMPANAVSVTVTAVSSYTLTFDGANCMANNESKYPQNAEISFNIFITQNDCTLPESIEVEGVSNYSYVIEEGSSQQRAEFSCTMTADVKVTVIATTDNPGYYTVIWKNYEGTVLETDTNVEQASMPSYNGDTPTRDANWEFVGWEPKVSRIYSDTTYTAQYEPIGNRCAIVFEPSAHITVSGNVPETIASGESLEFTIAADDDYVLDDEAVVFYGNSPNESIIATKGEYYNYDSSTGAFSCNNITAKFTYIYIQAISTQGHKLSDNIKNFDDFLAAFTAKYDNTYTEIYAVGQALGYSYGTGHDPSVFNSVSTMQDIWTPSVSYSKITTTIGAYQESYSKKIDDSHYTYYYKTSESGEWNESTRSGEITRKDYNYRTLYDASVAGYISTIGFDEFSNSYDERTNTYHTTVTEMGIMMSYYWQFDENGILVAHYQRLAQSPYSNIACGGCSQYEYIYEGDTPTPPTSTL